MFTVDDQAAGPHDASLDHERLLLEARDVEFDWANLPFHYVPNEPYAPHVLNVLHLLLPAGEEFFAEAGFHPSKLGGLGLAVDYLAVSPAARAAR